MIDNEYWAIKNFAISIEKVTHQLSVMMMANYSIKNFNKDCIPFRVVGN